MCSCSEDGAPLAPPWRPENPSVLCRPLALGELGVVSPCLVSVKLRGGSWGSGLEGQSSFSQGTFNLAGSAVGRVSLEKGNALPPLPNRGCQQQAWDPLGVRPKGRQALPCTRTASLGSVGLVAGVPFSMASPASLGPQSEVPGSFWI